MELSNLHQLGIAFLLGLLVGLQREWADERVAGARTFPLITVFGALVGLLSNLYGGWIVAAGLLALSSLIILGNCVIARTEESAPGLTTEVAALTMFSVGAILVAGYTEIGVAVGGGVAVLLQWKRPLHSFVEHLSEPDVRAVTRLVAIGLVVLPVLPNQTYGPYDVVNPFEIWLIVVLIVGISLVAYVVYKVIGKRVGTIIGGVLGGLISSTATTVSFARRTRSTPEMIPTATLVIMIASTVVFGRVIFEITVVAPEIVMRTAPPLLAMATVMAVACVSGFFLARGALEGELPQQEPPSTLSSAIIFGLLYAAVLIAVAAAKDYFGETGLYVVAVLSGLTDMDAITLSTARMIQSERVELQTGWRLILVGALSNMVFKTCVVAVLGGRRLAFRVAAFLGFTLAGGAAILWLWP